MSFNKEVEDSLQACHDIRNQKIQDDRIEEDKNFFSQNPFDSEIDRILNQISVDNGQLESPKEKAPVNEKKTEKNDDKNESVLASDAKQHTVLRTMLSVFVCIFTALLLALLITQYIAHPTSVEGSSMESALFDGDQLVVENVSYYFHAPERFDIIVFPNSQGVNYIKRIIGLPGEKIQIIDGTIYINEVRLEETYGKERIEDGGLADELILLGKQEYFVLGDNRNGSIDSRNQEVGTVKRNEIKGKAWLRLYPFSRFGYIE